MGNKKRIKKDQNESALSAGEKFLKELKELPYTNDRVGQAFIITRSRKPTQTEKDRDDQEKGKLRY